MAVTEQLILDLSRAQQQIRGLESELDSLLQPVEIPVELDADAGLAQLRRQLQSVDLDVNVAPTEASFRDLAQSLGVSEDRARQLAEETKEAARAAELLENRSRDVAQAMGLSDSEARRFVQTLRTAEREAGDVGDELQRANVAAGGFGSRVRDIATAFAAFQGGRAVFNFLSAGVQDAAALGESINQVNVLLGESAQSVLAFSESSTASLVLTQQEVLAAVGRFAGLANTVGLTQDQAAEFGTTLTDLAADLASFKDTSVDEAVQALGSALIGESEPLRRYDVLLNEAAVTAKALELGLGGVTGELSEAAKVQARYALILEQTVPAQGDLADTAESLGNRLKSTRVDLLEFRQELGEAVVPAVEEFLEVLPGVIDLLESAAPAVGAAASEFGNLVTPVAELAGIFSEATGPVAELSNLLGEAGEAGGFLAESGEAIKTSLYDVLLPVVPLLEEVNRAFRQAFPETVENPLVEGFRELQDLNVRGLGDVNIDARAAAAGVDTLQTSLRFLDSTAENLIADSIAGQLDDAGEASRRARLGLDDLVNVIGQLQTAGNAFGPLESELAGISQAFADTFAPDKNGEVFANIDELIAEINQQFSDAAEFESGLAELASRGFDDVAATFRERGPETIGLLREALADPSAASALESTLDAVGTAAGQGYAEGFSIGFNAASPELALEIADSVNNASVQQGIIAGALEMALLFAANFDPKILIDNFDISLPANVIRANIGGSAFGGGTSSPSGGGASSVGSSAQFQVNIINPTTTDLSTSAGQAAQTISAVSGLVN